MKLFAATFPWGDAAIAALCPDHEGSLLIDQMPYEKLYALLADIAPTMVAWEPCGGSHQIGHEVKTSICLSDFFKSIEYQGCAKDLLCVKIDPVMPFLDLGHSFSQQRFNLKVG